MQSSEWNVLSLVGAGMLGVMFGVVLAGDRGRIERALGPKIEAVEARLAPVEALADAPAALEALTATTGFLAGRISALETAAPASGSRGGASAAELERVVSALAQLQQSVNALQAPAATGDAGEAPARPPAQPPGGLALGVGQTAQIGAARIYLARISGGEAHVVVVGRGAARLSPTGAPLELAEGCALAYEGAFEERAYFTELCG